MSFRGYDDSGAPTHVEDPFARFVALDRAFESHRGLLGDVSSQRFAAISLVLCPGEPEQLVAQRG